MAFVQHPFLNDSFEYGGCNAPFFYGRNNGVFIDNLVGRPFAVNGLNRETYTAGQFSNNRQCVVGSKNIDMACSCPGSKDTAPWQPICPALLSANNEVLYNNFKTLPGVPDVAAKYLLQIHGRYH